MKKILAVSSILLSSTLASACLGEAQIIATVTQVEKTMTNCKVFPSVNTVRFYSSSNVCPMDISEVISEGVLVDLTNGHDCAIELGGEINGTIVRQKSKIIILEQ